MGDYYPTRPITALPQQDQDRIKHSLFQVQVKVHVQWVRGLPKEEQQNDWFVCVSSDFDSETHRVPIASSPIRQIIRVNITVPLNEIQLWWPNNMGAQPLYHVQVSLQRGFTATSPPHNSYNDTNGAHTYTTSSTNLSIQKRIGFRILQLVTTSSNINKTQETLRQDEGSGRTGMFFRINGADVYCRGANVKSLVEKKIQV